MKEMLRHTRTGRLYAHASTQTKRLSACTAVLYTRDAQTAFYRYGSAQTTRDGATQTWRALDPDDAHSGTVYYTRECFYSSGKLR